MYACSAFSQKHTETLRVLHKGSGHLGYGYKATSDTDTQTNKGTHTETDTHTHTYIYIYICIYIYIYVRACVYLCAYVVCAYIYIHFFICLFIDIHMIEACLQAYLIYVLLNSRCPQTCRCRSPNHNCSNHAVGSILLGLICA